MARHDRTAPALLLQSGSSSASLAFFLSLRQFMAAVLALAPAARHGLIAILTLGSEQVALTPLADVPVVLDDGETFPTQALTLPHVAVFPPLLPQLLPFCSPPKTKHHESQCGGTELPPDAKLSYLARLRRHHPHFLYLQRRPAQETTTQLFPNEKGWHS
eukprot:1490230-Rhodomonas_salina.1